MSFEALVGQDALRRALASRLAGRITGHAYLLSGPPGSGKKTWAEAIARRLLCLKAEGLDACRSCDSCRFCEGGNHPSLFRIKPDGRSIKIEQIRAVRQGFYYLGGSKVCLIEQAEVMTGEAAASLLKVLEEPPPGLCFILLSARPRAIPGTVISRCSHFPLQPLKPKELEEILAAKKGLPAERATFLAYLGNGNPGRVLQLAADDKLDSRVEEAANLARQINSNQNSSHRLIMLGGELAERPDLIELLQMLGLLFREALRSVVKPGCSDSLLPGGRTSGLEKASPESLENAILILNRGLHDLVATNVNRRLLLEVMMISLRRRLQYDQDCRGAL